jgi:hypothetical protein
MPTQVNSVFEKRVLLSLQRGQGQGQGQGQGRGGEDTHGGARAVSLCREVVAAQPPPEEDLSQSAVCTSKSWFSSGRIVWSDLSATGGMFQTEVYASCLCATVCLTLHLFACTATPAMAASAVGSMHAVPATPPAALVADPGDLAAPAHSAEQAEARLGHGIDMLQTYSRQLHSLATQMSCDLMDDLETHRQDAPPGASVWTHLVSVLGSELSRGGGAGSSAGRSPACAHVVMRLGLLRTLAAAEAELKAEIIKSFSPDTASYISDIVEFQSRFQFEVLRTAQAGLLHQEFAESRYRSSFLASGGDAAPLHSYMGELCQLILTLAEQAVAPPITLTGAAGTDSDSDSGMHIANESEKQSSLFSAYHNTAALVKASEGFLEPLQSLESLSLFELTESFVFPKGAKTDLKFSNAIIQNMNQWSLPPVPLSGGGAGGGEGGLLPLYYPDKIEVSVYVVVLHSAYAPLGRGGMQMSLLLSEIQKLRLPSQRMAITVHAADVAGETRLARALLACRRTAGDPETGRPHAYLDPRCVWGHLKEEDAHQGVKGRGGKHVQRLVRIMD